ncbi:MAG: PQQ-dependent sugar dehydrogenase [Phycisphaeraceae bacterium]|nr:PQQ-dependent sugar dehydrogenase [Phycisphaeraceae bacterium]
MTRYVLPLVLAAVFASFPVAANAQLLPAVVDGFKVRPGYEVTVAVQDLPGARFLEVDDQGTVYCSLPRSGQIVALKDTNGDGTFDSRTIFVANKPLVHGLCFFDGWLWFATSGSIHKARDTNADGVADEVVDIVPAGSMPRGGTHWWRSLLVTPDGLYTSIGDGSNISDQTKTDRQKIWSFSLDGSGKQLFASGIRNTEKLRIRPGTSEIWGFDHGSDNFGEPLGDRPGIDQPITDLNPSDEFNLYTKGGFYGHPFIVGDRIPRYEYRDRADIHDLAKKTIPPQWKVGAHWATNGWCFIDPAINDRTGAFPKDHNGDAFVACHGSWNSSLRVGYCIARVLFDPTTGRPYGLLKVVDTIDAGDNVAARPVDCVQMPDGSILFSSDQPGRIYRLRATPSK